MAVAKRCPYCLKKLRADGTCQNPSCPRYVPEDAQPKQEEPAKGK
jgi:hypothetical protein